jgi:hypothetical protein
VVIAMNSEEQAAELRKQRLRENQRRYRAKRTRLCVLADPKVVARLERALPGESRAAIVRHALHELNNRLILEKFYAEEGTAA